MSLFAEAGLGTSAKSIKLQVKKELEQERKAAALAEQYSEPKEVILDGAPMLAVSGVFFKCPLIGPEVLLLTFQLYVLLFYFLKSNITIFSL